MAARHFLVSGIVQGVGFRWFTERAAQALGLSGWVRNLHDGRVEILAMGSEAQLDRLEAECQKGPRSSDVTELSVAAVEAEMLPSFTIRQTAADPERFEV